jgi:antitoxin ParD1/3/4
MPQVPTLHITLSPDALKYVQNKVSNGEYASESDLLNESVVAMQEHEAELEAWFREVGAPAYARFLADPTTAIPIEKVMENLEARRRKRQGNQ